MASKPKPKPGVDQDQSNKADLKKAGVFVRGVSTARRWVGDLENYPSLTVESGRYHIYIAYNCPWCHRVALARGVLGLQDAISMDVLCFKREDTNGKWQFNPQLEKELLSTLANFNESQLVCTEDTGNIYNGKKMREAAKIIPEIYALDKLTQSSVPILYDKKEQRVVNNESAEIIVMLSTVFLKIAKNPLGLDLYPIKLQSSIDEINVWIYNCINNGSYIAGFSSNQAKYEEYYERYFNALDRIEGILSQNRFLLGDELTLADIRLFPTLFRHDAVYYIRMFLNKHYLKEYPNITNYLQNLYQIPGIAESSNLTHCIFGYFGRTWRRVIPKIPLKYAIDFNGKHNRIEKFGKCRIDTAIDKMDKKEDNINEAKEDLDADKDCVTISAHNGANVVKISVHGATVISWKVNGVERLFLSSKAKLDGSKAVRGGIPLVFPQFGPGAMKQHGFARMLKWKVLEMDDKRAYSNRAILYLENEGGVTDSEPWNWKHKFRLEYRVTIVNATTIETDLKIVNKNEDNNGNGDAFEFTTLFHNYFRINDICKVKIDGVNKDTFAMKIDKVGGKTIESKEVKENEFVNGINGETDCVLVNHDRSKVITIDDVIEVKQGNSMNDIVVWNPWKDKSIAMSDMDDDGYKKFVCVEVGSVTKQTQLVLKPGQSCVVSQELSVK